MTYAIYFDESNKLDQPNGDYSYYGALGSSVYIMDEIVLNVERLKNTIKSKSELHFVDYTSNTHFEKYFKAINDVLARDISINLMIVNKKDAQNIAKKMNISLLELRELFYVKIPERLFYGMTRRLNVGEKIEILIDENSEYEKIELEKKLAEQMNAHSAYRNKGYRVANVKQVTSDNTIPLQIIDVFMGIAVFLMEKQYIKNTNNETITATVKSDLIYRILIHQNNLQLLHNKVTIYKWEGDSEEISKLNLSEFTGEFLIYKTQYDIQEMKKLAKLKVDFPEGDTKFFRVSMGYSTRQLKMIQGYLSELNGQGRNDYYIKKDPN